MIEVLESARKVCERAREIRINRAVLESTARKMAAEKAAPPPWDTRHHFFDGGEKTVAYFLVLDTLNFCFWPLPETPRWEIDFKGGKISGYHAMAAALKKAMEAGIPLYDARWLAGVTEGQLMEVLGGRGVLQLMERRAVALNELGSVLIEFYGGEAHELVEAAGGSAQGLARLLADKLPSFRDVAEYEGEPVYFYKRTQIFPSDLHGAFEGKAWGAFMDIDRLTAFADYKLPQVLRQLGILEYSPELSRLVDRCGYLEAGSAVEVEIRAGTVWAVDLLRRELEKEGHPMAARDIDWVLWNMGQQDRFRKRPYHRTVTIYY
ncbi:MAG: queuosine salvage family protein [Deltaproteobacteria bacterium]|nr:queuosine salvage family protein [Deltaproteobacteria bacterium]MBW2130289.1 queuosine salvage family protein [Deltaproteobacteria bacterium]